MGSEVKRPSVIVADATLLVHDVYGITSKAVIFGDKVIGVAIKWLKSDLRDSNLSKVDREFLESTVRYLEAQNGRD